MTWGAGYDQFVSYKNIIKERRIICIAWQWEGQPVQVETWDSKMNDRKLVNKIIPVIAAADEVVGHNIERFDMPWIRTRAMFHKLPPVPLVKNVDTLRWARKFFYLNSNKLDYLTRFLGIEGKSEQFTEGEGAWRRVMDNDRKALAEMAEYCADDVSKLLKPAWERLSVVCPITSHAGVAAGKDKWSCPRCAGTKVRHIRAYVTAKGGVQHQMRCGGCGGYFSISDKIKKDMAKAA